MVILLLLALCALAIYLHRRRKQADEKTKSTLSTQPGAGEAAAARDTAVEVNMLSRVSAVTSRLFRVARRGSVKGEAGGGGNRSSSGPTQVGLAASSAASTMTTTTHAADGSSSVQVAAVQPVVTPRTVGHAHVRRSIDNRRMSAQEAALVNMIAKAVSSHSGSSQSIGFLASVDSPRGGDGGAGAGAGGGAAGASSQSLGASGGDGSGDGGGGSQGELAAGGSMEAVTEDAWAGFEQAVTEAYSRHDASGEGRLSVSDAEAALSEVGVELQPGQLLQLLQQTTGEADAAAEGRVVTLREVLEVLAMVLDLPAGDGEGDDAPPDAPVQSESAV